MNEGIEAEKAAGVDIRRGAEMLWSIEDQIAALEIQVRTLKGTAKIFHEHLNGVAIAMGLEVPVNPRSGGGGK